MPAGVPQPKQNQIRTPTLFTLAPNVASSISQHIKKKVWFFLIVIILFADVLPSFQLWLECSHG